MLSTRESQEASVLVYVLLAEYCRRPVSSKSIMLPLGRHRVLVIFFLSDDKCSSYLLLFCLRTLRNQSKNDVILFAAMFFLLCLASWSLSWRSMKKHPFSLPWCSDTKILTLLMRVDSLDVLTATDPLMSISATYCQATFARLRRAAGDHQSQP